MDPNTVMAELQTLCTPPSVLGDLRHATARIDCKERLAQWLERGGFEPDWDHYPQATAYLRGQI